MGIGLNLKFLYMYIYMYMYVCWGGGVQNSNFRVEVGITTSRIAGQDDSDVLTSLLAKAWLGSGRPRINER